MHDMSRFVPLCPAWGLQVPLSYQRPGYAQASVEHVVRVGLDQPLQFGANYIDLYPSNKEAAFPDREDYKHKMWPRFALRERPDDDQAHRWTYDTFRQFNRDAHARGYLVAYFMHFKFPHDDHDEWWSIMSAVHAEMAEQIGHAGADGVDGLGSEGHSVKPVQFVDLMWDAHPGMYMREASHVYDDATPHHIRTYGFHLSDGRDYFYGGARWNKPAYPIEVYRGEPHRLDGGCEFVGFQAEARDVACDDPGWGMFARLAGPDAIVEQLNNLYRAKLINPRQAATTATWFINEPLISDRMKRYAWGVAQDPVRCAVAGELFTTAADGPFPRVAHPKGTHFIQNNHLRAYVRENGRIELHADIAGRGNYTDFIETTRRLITEDLLQIEDAGPCDVSVLEEAGVYAALRVRFAQETWTLRLTADSPRLSIDIERSQPTRTRIGLARTGADGRTAGRFDSPTVQLQLDGVQPDAEPTQAGFIFTHDTDMTMNITLPGDGVETIARRIPDPGGAVWVCEEHWWMRRAVQPSLMHPGEVYVKSHRAQTWQTEVRVGDWLNDAVAPGWGCQYILRFNDAQRDRDRVSATVRVEDVGPLWFAPRVRLPFSVASVQLDNRPWVYFDGDHVFLPNRRGEFQLQAQAGQASCPHLIATFAVVEAARWQDNALHVKTALPPWIDQLPPGYRFRLAVRTGNRRAHGVHGGSITRQSADHIVIACEQPELTIQFED